MRLIAVMVTVAALAWVAGCKPKVQSPPPAASTTTPAAKAPAATPPAGENAQAEEAAVAAADAWLKLVDEGKYDESWAQTATLFRKAVTQADWAKQMKAFREPLGDVVSRKVQSKQYATALPGAPDGE
jgi:hypothetical protein